MTTYQGELTSQEVVKLIEAETDEGGNILEELMDQDVRGIYEQLSYEDKRMFRQFRKFHHQYFGVYGEHLPSYHMARQVMKDLMTGLPSASSPPKGQNFWLRTGSGNCVGDMALSFQNKR